MNELSEKCNNELIDLSNQTQVMHQLTALLAHERIMAYKAAEAKYGKISLNKAINRAEQARKRYRSSGGM